VSGGRPPLADRARRKADLIAFLATIQRPDSPLGDIDEHEDLVEARLHDSLALLEIVLYLETTHGIDFRERGVDAEDLATVAAILDLVERLAG
jgi:acyl carrier protein